MDKRKKYPQGCLIRSTGSLKDAAGHTVYYDVEKDIVFAGGEISQKNGQSGVSLNDYLHNKLNASNEDCKEHMTIFDHSLDEIYSLYEKHAKILGVDMPAYITLMIG